MAHEDWPYWDRSEIDKRRALLKQFAIATDCNAINELLPSLTADLTGTLHARHNTRRCYTGNQRHYVLEAIKSDLEPLMPTPSFWDAHFTKYATGKRITTVHRYAAAIADLFHQHELPSPTKTDRHKRLMYVLGQMCDSVPKRAPPFNGQQAKQLLRDYSTDIFCEARDQLMILLGVSRGFRGATIVSLHIKDVRIETAGVLLNLRSEKTARGSESIVTATPHTRNHEFCLPCTTASFISTLNELGFTSGPLFRGVDKWGNISDRCLSTRAFRDIFRRGLTRAGIEDPARFSPHSLRHGVVAAGVAAGLSDGDIMKITMHRSMRGFRAYRDAIDPWSRAYDESVLDLDSPTFVSDSAGWDHKHA
jgi:integrase